MTSYHDLADDGCFSLGFLVPQPEGMYCSGLAIVARYPFEEISFNRFTKTGDIGTGEGLVRKGNLRFKLRYTMGLKPNGLMD